MKEYFSNQTNKNYFFASLRQFLHISYTKLHEQFIPRSVPSVGKQIDLDVTGHYYLIFNSVIFPN